MLVQEDISLVLICITIFEWSALEDDDDNVLGGTCWSLIPTGAHEKVGNYPVSYTTGFFFNKYYRFRITLIPCFFYHTVVAQLVSLTRRL